MDTEDIRVVRDTWARVEPIAATAATLFYDRLFELDPSLRGLFPADLSEQKKKLMKTLGVAVASLGALDKLVPVLERLGRDHVGYGVETRHYATVGAALLWTLENGLGTEWTPAAHAAWSKTYALVAETMIRAAEAESGATS